MPDDTPRLRAWLLLMLGGLLLWAGFTRPLPLHFASAIPCTYRSAGGGDRVAGFVPGDHIQLLYHFWLCRDMLAGKTPAFANVYEFDCGGDGGLRRKFDPYYVPFSLVYAIVSPAFGHAAGWNAAGLFSVLLGLAGFFVLALRYTRSPALASAAALVASAFPYRWICLLGGSPTGFAASLVPWLAYGLDRAVRDGSPKGGLVAGLALLASYCSDLHVFYFGALAAPCWCLFAWLAGGRPLRPSRRRLLEAARALLPFALPALAAVALAAVASANIDKSTMSAGRALKELALFSPIKSGLFRWETLAGGANQIFFGRFLFLLLLLASVLWLRFRGGWRAAGKRAVRDRAAVVLLSLAVLAVFLLALGTNGPFGGAPVKIARRLVPKYTMIRQTAKIFCLEPVLLTVLGTVFLAPLAEGARPRRGLAAVVSLLALAAIAEQMLWFRPGLSRLPESVAAYDVAAGDAAARGVASPRAVAIPLWPGDSHWSSAYEYGVMGSRLRLLNGYSPAVPGGYHAKIFKRLESLNEGALSKGQADYLRGAGFDYILFHERPYPPKVAPFPAHVAEERLLASPLLRLVCRTNAVWAFRVAPSVHAPLPLPADGPAVRIPDYEAFPASFQWPASRVAGRGADCHTATNYLLRLRSPVAAAPMMRYKALASGGGALRSDSGLEVAVPGRPAWIDLPFAPPSGENWHVAKGRPVIHHALVAAGDESRLRDAPVRKWPAATFFHLGVSLPGNGAVFFSAADVACADVLHGPDLPLPPGRYRARLVSAPAEEGEAAARPAGEMVVSVLGDGERTLAAGPVVPGLASEADFEYDGLAPLRIAFHFHRASDVTVTAIELIRR